MPSSAPSRDLPAAQRRHWQHTYAQYPEMYGQNPSAAAVHAMRRFRAVSARTVVELGAGHGRDTVYFARSGLQVLALDFSSTGLEQLRTAAARAGVGQAVTTVVHDVRDSLPVASGSADGVFAHMLLCMALSTNQIRGVVAEVARVLRPGGVFVYTVRHIGDPHYGAGVAHGDDIFEHGGFAVHFFSRDLVDELAAGWDGVEVHAFEEGELPRRLWRITQYHPSRLAAARNSPHKNPLASA
ncbi:class I SAM-dependent methyltransferase [Mycobacterium botniense]|nr:class I SAM-dependent methyltransferase [Mycobacterium botniense]